MDIIHVLPINDIIIHKETTIYLGLNLINGEIRPEITSECACVPKIKYEENSVIIIHDAFDGRK